jgi:hypothetical protein
MDDEFANMSNFTYHVRPFHSTKMYLGDYLSIFGVNQWGETCLSFSLYLRCHFGVKPRAIRSDDAGTTVK